MAAPLTLPRTGVRGLGAPVAAAAAGVSAWLAVGLWQPSDTGPILCPFRAVTGLDCPFCGATRAAAALAHGQFGAALDHNAFLVLVVLPVAVLGWVGWARGSWRGAAMPVANRTATILLVATAAWWVLRLAVPWLGSGTV